MDNDDQAPHSQRVAALASVSDRAVISGQSVTLRAHVWRDFQPTPRPGGKPLMATLTVETLDGQAFPQGWDAPRASFVHGSEVWQADLTDQPVPSSEQSRSLTRSARGGPAWTPGSSVDVIVDLRDAQGSEQRLRVQGQIIQQVD
jgi:hypothetical protein